MTLDLGTFDLGDNLLGADRLATAHQLVRDGRCSAMCLIAVDSEEKKCGCKLCGGEFHGALNKVLVPNSVRRPARADKPANEDLVLFEGPTAPVPAPAAQQPGKATGKAAARARRARRAPTLAASPEGRVVSGRR